VSPADGCTWSLARGLRHAARLVIVVGPCSVHDHDQAIAYGKLLKVQADQHAKNLQIVMRVYFEKPRTWTAVSR
jgi:phospho-2-dehydro-3-deoxyheptonate aldolase